MSGLINKILRDMAQRRARSMLTVLGIAVGVAGLVAIMSTSRNITRAQRDLFASTSQADITYWVWDAPPSLVPLLEADPRIAKAELRVTYGTRWRAGGSWMAVELVGSDDLDQVGINQFELVEGRHPKVGEILLDISASREAAVAIGSEIAYRDEHGRERFLRLSGVSQSPSYLSSKITNMAVGYVPAPFLRRMMSISGSNQLLIRLRDSREAQRVAERVNRLLRRQSLQAGSPEIRRPGQFPGKRELDALIVIMFLFSTLGVLLSSFLVANTLSATVAEQIGEIGILKAIGATRWQILLIYLLEALGYGLVGTLLGVIVGALGGWRLLVWMGSLGNAKVGFQLAPEGVISGLVVGLGIALLGALMPALRGMKVPVKEALESYGISADYGQGWLDHCLERLRGIPPLAAMAVRNLSRRKGRSALTLLVVSFATAAFIGAATTRDSVNAAIADIYSTYHADAWAWLGESVSSQFEDSLTTVDGVHAAEGWAIANGIVGFAEARLWGIPARSTLYREAMLKGRWFREDEPDAVVVSTELADDQRISLGDRVEIQVQGQARFFRVVGIAIDNTIFLGSTLTGKAFLPRSTLAGMLRQQGHASLFALGLASREPRIADEILAEVEHKFRRWRPLVQPVYAEIEAAREASRLLILALVAMLVLIAFVGSMGILNTLTLNVLERRREIAVMRAIGATNAALVLTFVMEALALGGLGWFLGLVIGYPCGRLLTRQLGQVLFSLEFVFSPQAVLGSLAFTLTLAVVSSIAPALAAAHTRAATALRYE